MQNQKAIFESYWGRKIDCNPEAIANALVKAGHHQVVWGLDDPSRHSWSEDYIACKRDSWSYLYHLATSKYFVTNVNFPNYFIKRDDAVVLQTFHGTPLKAMGIDIRNLRPYEMDWKSFSTRCEKWDFCISSNPYSTAIWRRSHPYNYSVIETGYPRNDALSNNAIDCARVRELLGVSAEKKIVLYAPTYRDDNGECLFSANDAALKLDRIQKALAPDFVLMVRAHHLSKVPEISSNVIDVSQHNSINDLLAVADVLITDYSSVMFDYAIQERPIIIYAYDFDSYSKDRGFYMDIRINAPGAVVHSLDDLIECLATKSYQSAENSSKLKVFREKFCSWEDGHSAQRVIQKVFKKSG